MKRIAAILAATAALACCLPGCIDTHGHLKTNPPAANSCYTNFLGEKICCYVDFLGIKHCVVE